MARFTRTLFMAGFLVCSSLSAFMIAAEPQPAVKNDDVARLKAAQQERIKVLRQLIGQLTSQYKVGTAAISQLAAAGSDVCSTLLDSTDNPDERIELLTKELERTNDVLKIAQARFDAESVSQSDVNWAKSQVLAVTIHLLRERSRKQNSDAAARLKESQEERTKVLTQLVEVLSSRYLVGTAFVPELLAAESDLCNVQLEARKDPTDKVTLLVKLLDKARTFLKKNEDGYAWGDTASETDVYWAKSHYLDVTIRLLQEQSKIKRTMAASEKLP